MCISIGIFYTLMTDHIKYDPVMTGCMFIAALLLFVGTASAADVPVAAFSGTPASGTSPLTVNFTDQSTGSPTGWSWFFGDETYAQPWTNVNASSGWTGRNSQSTVVMPDGSIVLMGGVDETEVILFNDTWRSTDNGATWVEMNASSGWSKRQGHSAVTMPDGSIVLMGGQDNSTTLNDTWRSTDFGATWTLVNASSGWSKRAFHSSVAMPDGSIVLMGGFNGSIEFNDTWQSEDYGATWKQMNASSGWLGRDSHTAVAMPDHSIILMGGFDNTTVFNDTWRSTDNGATWKEMNASSGWTKRWSHSSVGMPDGSVVLMGGTDDLTYLNNMNDTWRSTDNGATWMQVNASHGWSKRSGQSSVALPDGSIILLGGGDATTSWNDIWQLQPAGSSQKSPSHAYSAPGTYPVALQVFNESGYNSTRKIGYITVTSPVPGTTTQPSGPSPLMDAILIIAAIAALGGTRTTRRR